MGRLEGYNNTQFFNGGATPWAHMLVASLFVTPQSIPLPLLTGGGGLSIELYLAPHTDLFYGASNVAYYQMEGVSMKYLALTPDPAFTLGLKSAVAAGDSAYIPLQCIKAFPSNGNGSNNQIINVAIGQKTSIVSIQTVFWDSTGTGDKAIRFTNAGLTSWDIKAADIQNPANIQFQYGTNGAVPESLLTMLMTQVGSGYRIGDEVSLPANYDTQNFSVSFNFQSSGEHFASGLSTEGSSSPFITIETTHSAVVPASTNITTWVTYDCLMELKGNNILVHDIF